MKALIISGSNVGNKTRIAATTVYNQFKEKHGEDHTIKLLNLQDYDLVFSDGRNYLDYGGDTTEVLKEIMEADIILIGSPIFQASMPAIVKNLFDLLPQNALENKTCAMIITAGSDKHYLIPEQQYKPVFSYMKANIVPRYVYVLDTDFDRESIINDDVHFRIGQLIDDTMILATTYQEILQREEEAFGF